MRVHACVGENLPAGRRPTVALRELDDCRHDSSAGLIHVRRRSNPIPWNGSLCITEWLHCTSSCLVTFLDAVEVTFANS